MTFTGLPTAALSACTRDPTSSQPHRFGEVTGSTSSHGSSGLDDYKVLQPGDFARMKGQLSLRSRPASRIDWVIDSDQYNAIAASPGVPNLLHDASPLPPDFDLVLPARQHHLHDQATSNRATFGPWSDESEHTHEGAAAWADAKEDLLSVADEGSDTDAALQTNDTALQSTQAQPAAAPLSAEEETPQAVKQDTHLSQLKMEAEAAWANYRPGLRPLISEHESLASTSSTPGTPAQVPQRLASLRRSSLVAHAALAKPQQGSNHNYSASHSSISLSSLAHDTGTPSSLHAKLEPEYVPHPARPFGRGSLGSIRASPSEARFQRPYTASILSSTSEGSLLSYQNSFESGLSPLLLNRAATSGRLHGRSQRPATAGSITVSAAPLRDLHLPRPHLSASSGRPETTNQLSAEERRQQVRRTKKLAQMLGEEMLFATNAHSQQLDPAPRSHSLVASPADGRSRKHRPQSMPFSATGHVDAPGTFASNAGSKTRAFSRKLLHSRTHGVKSWDHASSGLNQNAVYLNLNRKAADVLGIPHPYSSNARANVYAGDTFSSDEELNRVEEIRSHTRPFVPSGLEEFNEPTPKVDQLAAFSAAALDEAASPTLPQDGPFRPFDRSEIDQALAVSESRKLAAARDERRRRVAKMSRWLGEAVPAELISSGTKAGPGAVIVSTGPSDPARFGSPATTTSDAHSLCGAPSSSACQPSSRSHGSISHESSVASNLHSFMSIDSSDEESGDDAAPTIATGRVLTDVRLVASSPRSRASERVAASDSLSTYRNSIESYEYLLENDRRRLGELASIFQHGRSAPRPSTVDTISARSRPIRPNGRPQTSPVTGSMPDGRRRGFQSLGHADYESDERPPRPSAAFLELSDSESDSSEADELPESDDASSFPTSRRQRAAHLHDRSISKLSNFFGSTPSQIVRSQSDMRVATSSVDSVSTVGNGSLNSRPARGGNGMRSLSQPEALKTMLRSLEEEAMDDSKLNPFQKSEISRRVHRLKKRTTKIFS
ncbi:hypothetical protein PaG_01911 [Moesziomyces aphidis]|uniref:Uncharacterized protein n=1 Tax=Moesziomyces aphidis TaxID=84754 RepID=W3VS39_MOEAP|nr:hypothetical protein PaG_01911 [Moesziomyces aphidis]